MRRLALAIALACVLSSVARAGEIHSTGATAPPPPPPPTSSASIVGEIHTTGATIVGEIPTTGATTPEPEPTMLTIILTMISIVS